MTERDFTPGPDTKDLVSCDAHYAIDTGSRKMHIFFRIMSFFIGLFIMVNGIWFILTPPSGDEPLAYVIVAIGIIIPIFVQYVAQFEDNREA
jgi:hypothetical protein